MFIHKEAKNWQAVFSKSYSQIANFSYFGMFTDTQTHTCFPGFPFFHSWIYVVSFSDDKRTGGKGENQRRKEEPDQSIRPSQEPTILITGVYEL